MSQLFYFYKESPSLAKRGRGDLAVLISEEITLIVNWLSNPNKFNQKQDRYYCNGRVDLFKSACTSLHYAIADKAESNAFRN